VIRSITAQGATVDPEYPLLNLVDDNPAKPGKLAGKSGSILFDFGSPRRIDLVSLIHHNLTTGLPVFVQANGTDTWGAPSVNAPMTIPTYRQDGYPVNPFLNVTEAVGWNATGYRFWRISFAGLNATNIAIGEIWMGRTIRILDPNVNWGESRDEERKIIEHKTDYGVSTIYDLGITQRTLQGTLANTPDLQRTEVQDWWRNCRGRVRPFLLIPSGTENEAWLVRWKDLKLAYKYDFLDQTTFELAFEEVGRGLVL
jgi:hypothetical protein